MDNIKETINKLIENYKNNHTGKTYNFTTISENDFRELFFSIYKYQNNVDFILDGDNEIILKSFYSAICGKTYKSFSIKNRAYTKENNDFCGFLLVGKTGTGKSSIFRAFIELLRNIDFEIYLTDKPLKPKFAEINVSNYVEFYKKNINKTFTYIDDLGSENLINDYGVKANYYKDLIESIYLNKDNSFVFISTNLSFDEIKTRYSERVFSRIVEMCAIYALNKNDYRII